MKTKSKEARSKRKPAWMLNATELRCLMKALSRIRMITLVLGAALSYIGFQKGSLAIKRIRIIG
jgi:hypothetical protein